MSSNSCMICLESLDGGAFISCAHGHAVCPPCFGQLVTVESEKAAQADPGALPTAFGRVSCPCSGADGCRAPPFEDLDVAAALKSHPVAFARYIELRGLPTVLSRTQTAFEEAQTALQAEVARLKTAAKEGSAPVDTGTVLLAKQLRRVLPNARQCRECGWGPMDFRACSDLAAHHGQVVASVRRGGEPDDMHDDGAFWDQDEETAAEASTKRLVKIDNSCPRCGWFSKRRRDWPKWDGVIHEERLPNAWEDSDRAARVWVPKVAEANKRADEADARAHKAETQLAAEREARCKAERNYLAVRQAIHTAEHACATTGARVRTQLEMTQKKLATEHALRVRLEEQLRRHHADGMATCSTIYELPQECRTAAGGKAEPYHQLASACKATPHTARLGILPRLNA